MEPMLKDKVAIVTGSATGIGAACAVQLAGQGCRVVINYSKSEQDAMETAEACRRAGAEAIVCQADVSRDEDCAAMVQRTMGEWGRVDILVNNAGTTKFANHKDLNALTAEDFQGIYATNVIGAYQMVKAVAPVMEKQFDEGNGPSGSVVNISSIAGAAGIGSSIAYAASKGAFNTMTLSLARSQGPFMRVNAVCPGFVGTRWFRDRFGEESFKMIVESNAKSSPLKRAGTPDDIAGAVMFFALPWSKHITGEILLVDAGAHLDLTPLTAR